MATAIRTGDAVAHAHPSTATTRHAGYLFHPVVDFLLAGGGSLLVALPVFLLIRDKEAVEATALWWGFALVERAQLPALRELVSASLHRHRRSGSSGANSTRKVRLRYIWAGFVAPVLIGGFLFAAYALGDVRGCSVTRQRHGVHGGLALREAGLRCDRRALGDSPHLLLGDRETPAAPQRLCRVDLFVDGVEQDAARREAVRRRRTSPSTCRRSSSRSAERRRR